MKIRVKLLSGFGLYTLLAVALGAFAFGELRAITGRLGAVETADDLTATVLEVRRAEKNYLLFKDEASAVGLRRHLQELREGAGRIAAKTRGEIPPRLFEELTAALAAYERSFDEVAAGVSGLRRADSGAQETMRARARDVQALAEDLSLRARTAIDVLLRRARRSLRILLLAVAAAIVVGGVVNARLSQSIAAPIGRLEELTHRIAAGDLSGRVALGGDDEFSSLAESFNRMQDRLHDTLTTLELANEDLRTKRVQLVEAEKFATLGRFAAGVAHEINNPLAIIGEKAGLMRDYIALAADFPDRERFTALLDAIVEGVSRGRATTDRILDLAGAVAGAVEAVDVNVLLAELLKSVEPQLLAKHILLQADLAEGLPAISTGRARVRQVLADLLKNRLDALAPGGVLRVSTGMKDAGTLQATVADDGPGLPPEELGRLFEPFSGAGEIGRDPGLGLWVSRGVMKKLGGEILVSSGHGRGTVFAGEIPVPGGSAGAR
jgi:signal transduction histidine kinase